VTFEVPPGFVLVPRYWTPEMLTAATQAPMAPASGSLVDLKKARIKEHWEAALQASPYPPDDSVRQNIKLGTVTVTSRGRASVDVNLNPEDLGEGAYSIEARYVGEP